MELVKSYVALIGTRTTNQKQNVNTNKNTTNYGNLPSIEKLSFKADYT